MPDISPSPIESPEGPDGPVSPETSFLDSPVSGVGGEVVTGVGGEVAPEGPQYDPNMVAERQRFDEEIAKI
eukprot:11172779-Karenia_brevis.AAC.1